MVNCTVHVCTVDGIGGAPVLLASFPPDSHQSPPAHRLRSTTILWSTQQNASERTSCLLFFRVLTRLGNSFVGPIGIGCSCSHFGVGENRKEKASRHMQDTGTGSRQPSLPADDWLWFTNRHRLSASIGWSYFILFFIVDEG